MQVLSFFLVLVALVIAVGGLLTGNRDTIIFALVLIAASICVSATFGPRHDHTGKP